VDGITRITGYFTKVSSWNKARSGNSGTDIGIKPSWKEKMMKAQERFARGAAFGLEGVA